MGGDARTAFPTPQELVQSEATIWEQFLEGSAWKIEVPPPPQILFNTLIQAEKVGLGGMFEPNYLAPIDFAKAHSSTDGYRIPNWEWVPNSHYWKNIEPGAATLPGAWALTEVTQTSEFFSDPPEEPIGDPLKQTMQRLRSEGRIKTPRYVPATSRFEVTYEEIETAIAPAVATSLDIDPEIVGVPSAIAFNVLGNQRYQHAWGLASNGIWLSDRITLNDGYGEAQLLTGGSHSGLTFPHPDGTKTRIGHPDGLTNICLTYPNTRGDFTWFRLQIVFPPE